MTLAEELGALAARVAPEDPDPPAREALAVHLLDALGCAIAGPGAPRLRAHLEAAGGRATALGCGRLPSDRAALWNAARIAAADLHDAYVGPDGVVHPAEMVGAVLAAAEEAGAAGGELVAGLAVAYELVVRLATAAPVRARGFGATSHLAIAAAAGSARALRLDAAAAAHAVALAAARAPVLGVVHDGAASDLAALAGPLAVRDGLEAALLARDGFTGPLDAFEGRRGAFEALTGPFLAAELLRPGLDAATAVAIRFHPGDPRAQAAIEAALDVAGHPDFAAARVTRVVVAVPPLHARRLTPPVATTPARDLAGLVAAALAGAAASGERAALAARVEVRGDPALAHRFPAEAPAVVRVHLGRAVLEASRREAEGGPGRPVSFDRALAKFERLASRAPPALRRAVVAAVRVLPDGSVADLCALLAAVR